MAKIRNRPRKHSSKPLTAKQELIVGQIQEDFNMRTWLEAKHEYFENQEIRKRLGLPEKKKRGE